MTHVHGLAALGAALVLAACGGSDDDDLPRDVAGTLKEAPSTVTTLTQAQIDAAARASGLLALSGVAQCDVKVVALDYHTLGPKNEDTNASGVLLLPSGPGNCNSPVPLVAYAKGTDVQKPRTLANPQDPETLMLVAMYAAQGYAVVATDYLGYAKSTFPYHPYLHADSEARSVLDSVRAARLAAPIAGGQLSDKLMLTGYSQGGHSSMAAQRAAERGNAFNVTAGAHLAGPYNLSGSFKLTNAIAGYQFFVPFMVTAWQKVYGDVYTDVNMVFKAPYAAGIEDLLPSPTLNYTTLVTSGALPGGTPNEARDALFQSAFLTDVRANPANALMLDAKKNDLFGWTPRATTLLCGGAGDPTVPPAVHMIPLKADFDARGVTTVRTVDVDAQVQALFAPGGVAPTDPASPAFATYYGSYHGTYEPPLCHVQARALFNSVR